MSTKVFCVWCVKYVEEEKPQRFGNGLVILCEKGHVLSSINFQPKKGEK